LSRLTDYAVVALVRLGRDSDHVEAVKTSPGIAAAIGLAIAYWIVAGMFEAMGNVNMLPAILAAWSPDLLFGLVGGYLLLRTPT